MPEPENKNQVSPDQEQQMREAVAFFEQILQSIPDDRVSLEVLSQTCEQACAFDRACDYLIRLAEVILRDSDREAAKPLWTRLEPYASQKKVDSVRNRLAKLAAMEIAASATATIHTAAEAETKIKSPAARRAMVAQELDFAWALHEEGVLTEELYASVVGDITDLSTNATPAPISVLHLFQDRQLPNIDRVMTFTSTKSGSPLLPLNSFEPQAVAFGELPLDYLIIKGVIPFEKMGEDLLVAMLNPTNNELRQELSSLTGRRCHFFLVSPSDFDQAIEKIRKQQK